MTLTTTMPKTESPVYLISMSKEEWKAVNKAADIIYNKEKTLPLFISRKELQTKKDLVSIPFINFNHDITIIPDGDGYKVGVTARAEAYFNPESTNKIIRNARARKISMDMDAKIEEVPKTEESGILGSGGLGYVEVIQYEDGSIDAVKIEPAKLNFTKEIEILRELGDLRAFFIKKGENREINKKTVADVLHIVQQMHPGISLYKYFTSHNLKNLITLEQKYMLAIQIALSVQQLHDKNILHCDLKPDNFIINCNGDTATVTVIDFGLSVHLEQGKNCKMGPHGKGSFFYMAPEARYHGVYSKKSDMYALGELFERLFKYNLAEDENIRDLVEQMKATPHKRPNIEEVIRVLKIKYDEQHAVATVQPSQSITK